MDVSHGKCALVFSQLIMVKWELVGRENPKKGFYESETQRKLQEISFKDVSFCHVWEEYFSFELNIVSPPFIFVQFSLVDEPVRV